MKRKTSLYLSLLLLCTFAIVLSLNSCGGNSATNTGPIQPGKIEHVVVIFQENRTPDNLFQDPTLIAKGADIAAVASTPGARPFH